MGLKLTKRGLKPATTGFGLKPATTGAAFLVLVFCLQEFMALPRLSATSDEAVHLSAGYSYWKTQDFRMNGEHPPLAKLIAALPLLVIQPKLDTSTKAWTTNKEYEFGFIFLYRNDADRLLFWGRFPMVLLAALGAAITFMWTRDLFGPVAALFAVGLYAFSPNLLAHGMLITTDVPVAVFSLLTLYLFWRQGEHPTWRNSLAIGFALGAAMTSKYSGGLLPILILALACARGIRQADRKAALLVEARSLVVVAAASLFVIEAAYLFSASPLIYFKNAALVNANHSPAYQFYLLGQLRQGGWWYYFPVAFLFKASLTTLILILLAAARARSGFVDRRGEIILLSGIGFFFIVMSAGANDVGIRYLLPIFPLIFIWVSRIVPAYWSNPLGKGVMIVLFGWHMWSALSTSPNYIPFFNELAGGASGGPAILDDSNVDWGQALKQAAAYVKEKRIDDVVMYSFSPFDNPPYYGLPRNLLAPEWTARVLFKQPPSGTYLISAHYVARMKALDPAWRAYRPIDRVGESLWVYRF